LNSRPKHVISKSLFS